MFSFSMPELILVLVIALVVFGPGKLPEVGKALGKSLQEFKRATTNLTKEEPINISPSEEVKKQPPPEAAKKAETAPNQEMK